jgi:hypothetical protein
MAVEAKGLGQQFVEVAPSEGHVHDRGRHAAAHGKMDATRDLRFDRCLSQNGSECEATPSPH